MFFRFDPICELIAQRGLFSFNSGFPSLLVIINLRVETSLYNQCYHLIDQIIYHYGVSCGVGDTSWSIKLNLACIARQPVSHKSNSSSVTFTWTLTTQVMLWKWFFFFFGNTVSFMERLLVFFVHTGRSIAWKSSVVLVSVHGLGR